MITAKDLAEAVAALEEARRILYGTYERNVRLDMDVGDRCLRATYALKRALEKVEVKVTP